MFQIGDLRNTRVYQDARAEGFQEGFEKSLEKCTEKAIEKCIEIERQRSSQEKLTVAVKLAARNMCAVDIADILGLDVEVVLKTMDRKS